MPNDQAKESQTTKLRIKSTEKTVLFYSFSTKYTTFAPAFRERSLAQADFTAQMLRGLCYGVMVTLQVLDLSFQVRILVAQHPKNEEKSSTYQSVGLVAQLVRATDS